MSNTVFIPEVKSEFVLSEDWQVELEWRDRNLRMLKAFNLTGTKKTNVGWNYVYDDDGRIVKDEQGRAVREEVFHNKTVANPIFKDYDGTYAPALVTFPKGTKFIITKFSTGYQNDVRVVDLKCLDSEKKGIKNLCIQLPRKKFNGVIAEFSE